MQTTFFILLSMLIRCSFALLEPRGGCSEHVGFAFSAFPCQQQKRSRRLCHEHGIKYKSMHPVRHVVILMNLSQDDTLQNENEQAITLSTQLLKGLRRRTPSLSCSSPVQLNLETDFYDLTTGLHSEGVWHNCLAGVVSLKLAELQQQDKEENLLAAIHIANSLWGHSWDGISFQRRSWSGLWDHSNLKKEGAVNPPPEQANYYCASTEHRCIQHGMALVFWAKLIHYLQSHDNELHYRYQPQYRLTAKQFQREYWDESNQKWHTVSKDQGGGTLQRPSASSGSKMQGTRPEEASLVYYRAVDQAVSILACLEMLHMDQNNKKLVDILKITCQQLLSEFGYGSDEGSSYIGIQRNQNLWHDGWVALALLSCARQSPECWPNSKPQEDIRLLLERLQCRYGDNDGTMWHWATTQKASPDSGNVRYCGDNALWYAITQSFQEWVGSNIQTQLTNGQNQSFWNFVHELQSQDDDGLVSVADVYPQVRLHPNTELATLVLWPIET